MPPSKGNLFHELHNEPCDLLLPADDHVVLSLDDVQVGIIVDFVIFLAAPERDYAVPVTMDQSDRP